MSSRKCIQACIFAVLSPAFAPSYDNHIGLYYEAFSPSYDIQQPYTIEHFHHVVIFTRRMKSDRDKYSRTKRHKRPSSTYQGQNPLDLVHHHSWQLAYSRVVSKLQV